MVRRNSRAWRFNSLRWRIYRSEAICVSLCLLDWGMVATKDGVCGAHATWGAVVRCWRLLPALALSDAVCEHNDKTLLREMTTCEAWLCMTDSYVAYARLLLSLARTASHH